MTLDVMGLAVQEVYNEVDGVLIMNKIDLGALGEIELINIMGSDLTVVNSARISFSTKKEEIDTGDIKLIKYLIKHNHVSTLEHCYMTFRVKCPKPIVVQWMRHQSQKFNEVSLRYTEVKDEFYIPDEFRKQHTSSKQASVEAEWSESMASSLKDVYTKAIDHAYKAYKVLLENGVAKEQARMVLPFGFMTEFVVTMNLRSFLHWYVARSDAHSQWEIQQFAKATLELVEPHFKHSIEAFKEAQNV